MTSPRLGEHSTIKLARRLNKAFPESDIAFGILGQTLRRAGLTDEAKQCFHCVLRLILQQSEI